MASVVRNSALRMLVHAAVEIATREAREQLRYLSSAATFLQNAARSLRGYGDYVVYKYRPFCKVNSARKHG